MTWLYEICLKALGNFAAVTLSFVAMHGAFENLAHAPSGQDTISANKQRYLMLMRGCAIEFVAKKGGGVKAYVSSQQTYGDFFHSNYFENAAGAPPFNFTLRCYEGSAQKLCSRFLPENTREDIHYYNIRRINNLNPYYYSEAQVASYPMNNSRPGQIRELTLCLGDDRHILVSQGGGFRLGYDSRDISITTGKQLQPTAEANLHEVLKIIESIRFVSSEVR